MTERYLLNELVDQERDAFEEHYFDCPACALDVTAGHQFVAHTRVVLADEPAQAEAHAPEPQPVNPSPARGWMDAWFSWLRPAFAAPALAALLIVAGYQNLVTVPGLRSALSQPRVLPAVHVSVGVWGDQSTGVPEGEGLLLQVRISSHVPFERYTVDVTSPSGKSAGPVTITPADGQDLWSVSVPTMRRETGRYTMAAHGITASGEVKDLGTTAFQLQIQK